MEKEFENTTVKEAKQTLESEMGYYREQLETLQAEKRAWVQQSLADDIDADTYEQVIKQEFSVMKRAFEHKAVAAEAKVVRQEKDHVRQTQALIRAHRVRKMRCSLICGGSCCLTVASRSFRTSFATKRCARIGFRQKSRCSRTNSHSLLIRSDTHQDADPQIFLRASLLYEKPALMMDRLPIHHQCACYRGRGGGYTSL